MTGNDALTAPNCAPDPVGGHAQQAKVMHPTPRRFELNTLRGIRREMGAVYKLARTGEMQLADACRYAYLLSTLSKISESELLEQRLDRLEELSP